MKILIACEESQRVCIAFRKRGHEAYSCDIQECSGGHTEWHIQDDVIKVMWNSLFQTMDGVWHNVPIWDMIIAFPPCTHLATSGARWFPDKRADGRQDAAIRFFMEFANYPCDKIAIENPVGIMSTHFRKPDQIIQPYMFGDPYEKKTCLWLKGLPKLIATKIVDKPDRVVFASGKSMPKWYADAYNLNKEERAKIRSKTFPGIAEAMSEQWGKEYIV